MESHGVNLGRWVRARRSGLGMTQEQVWARVNVEGDPNYLAHLESGRKKNLPDNDILNGLARSLGVSGLDVLRGAGLPVDDEDVPQESPDSHMIHKLVDMIDWAERPHHRKATEAFLRSILEQQSASGRSSLAGERDRQ